jgi:ATP-dependent DNA helicase RecG
MYVRGVGPRVATLLEAKGIRTAEDLLYHLPFRYEDRQHPKALYELKAGETASVIGEIRSAGLVRTNRKPIFEIVLAQGAFTIKCMWFNGGYLQGRLRAGQAIALFGRMEASRSSRNLKMIQPQFELLPEAGGDEQTRLLEVGRITPVYESLGGAQLASRWQRKVIFQLLESIRGNVPECLPGAIRKRNGLPERETALAEAHFPLEGTAADDLEQARTPAQRRLIFEELFFLELGLELKRRRSREQKGIAFATTEGVREAIREILPFHPTTSQKRSLGEIVADMREPHPMRRLLQGDVGSGKTIVALQAMVVAMENGYQTALMAPTEILATQHYLAARKLLGRSSRKYRMALLTGSVDAETKRALRRQMQRGEVQLVIGTHALIEENVEFDRLGLVVVDEQHRFGVMQRFRLMKKPNDAEPDVLVMTATPIPRTLALTLYGDLDTSVLDDLPPGRTPITTRRVASERAEEVWEFVHGQVAAGRQAYIVYPVIEGSRDDQQELDFAQESAGEAEVTEKPKRKSARSQTLFANEKTTARPRMELRSATEMHEQLRTRALAGLRVGLLHGRMSADEKEVVMRRFQRGEVDVLVATTVVEVGVDVPNATVMVIDHAERFGLAQLHQLRGRVGRGSAKSFCILMTGERVSAEAEQRLEAMVATQNGFELAELDLKMRGPGEFFGTRQAGLPGFRVVNLVRDRELLEMAKQEAVRFVTAPDPEVTEAERRRVWDHLKQSWQRRYGLMEAG